VKKLFVLMFVVLAVASYVIPTSTHRAEAGICPPEYISKTQNQTFDVIGDTTVAARVTINVHDCYDNASSSITSVSASSYTLHPRWDNGTSTITLSLDTQSYQRYRVHVKFNRWYADGSTRQPVCVDYDAEADAKGRIWITEVNSKYLCWG
jgi:hypothetical protein